MKHGVAEVSICQGIGTILEPDDNRMKLTHRSDTWVMNVEVDNNIRYNETQRRIEHMCCTNVLPDSVELSAISLVLRWV